MMTIVPVSRIRVGDRFRKDMGDIDALATSIRSHGLLHPIVITSDYALLCGGRRFEAMRRLGMDAVEARVIDPAEPLLVEQTENETHKPFTASERVAIARAIEDRLRDTPRDPDNPRGESREAAADRAGFGSREEYRRAALVVEQGVPELVEAMDDGLVAISAAAELAGLSPEEQAEIVSQGPGAIRAKVAEVRQGKSRVNGELVDDPPDVAEARANGRIGADVVPEVTDDTISIPAPEPAEPVQSEEEQLDEWLKSLPLFDQLAGAPQNAFLIDAQVYKKLSHVRDQFRRNAAPLIRGKAARGEYAYRLSAFLKINDPKHWQRCAGLDEGGCAGTGQVPTVGQCPKCHGRGYWIR